MRRLFVLSFTFISLLFLSGCIEFNMNIELNPDGSGTITEEVLFSQKFVQMMESFSQMGEQESEEFNMYNPDELKSKAKNYGEGVELVKSEVLERKSMKGYSAVYRFRDINKLKVDDDPASKMPDDMPGQESSGDSPYSFSFVKGNPSVLKIYFDPGDEDFEEGDFEEEDDSEFDENEMMFEQMKDLMRDMRTSIVLEIDGDIVSTNATNIDNNKITLIDMNFGALFEHPEKLKEFKNLKLKNFEEAKEFLSDIEGIKIEFNEELEVKFK